VSEICTTHGENVKCLQNIDLKTSGEETTWEDYSETNQRETGCVIVH